MIPQNQLILSLGTNLGNRLDNIQKCTALIREKLGVIAGESRIYETPAWGFKSDSFYNCALLLHTQFSAIEVLQEAKKIEQELGRSRIDGQGYQARIIDIDIVAYNDDVIKTNSLAVPHPLMQDRNFVLLPMADLEIDWTHPILNKNVKELIASSADQSICKPVLDIID